MKRTNRRLIGLVALTLSLWASPCSALQIGELTETRVGQTLLKKAEQKAEPYVAAVAKRLGDSWANSKAKAEVEAAKVQLNKSKKVKLLVNFVNDHCPYLAGVIGVVGTWLGWPSAESDTNADDTRK